MVRGRGADARDLAPSAPALKGVWRISDADQHNAVLSLKLDDGSVDSLPLSWDGEKTYVGSERWFREKSDACP